jgi:hypothetical protein
LKRVFLGEEWKMGYFHPFPKQVFLKNEIVDCFWGWKLTQRAVSWVAWEGKVWLFFKAKR